MSVMASSVPPAIFCRTPRPKSCWPDEERGGISGREPVSADFFHRLNIGRDTNNVIALNRLRVSNHPQSMYSQSKLLTPIYILVFNYIQMM